MMHRLKFKCNSHSLPGHFLLDSDYNQVQLEPLEEHCDLERWRFWGVAQAAVTVRQTAKDRERKSR
jgi:hypothetical protein